MAESLEKKNENLRAQLNNWETGFDDNNQGTTLEPETTVPKVFAETKAVVAKNNENDKAYIEMLETKVYQLKEQILKIQKELSDSKATLNVERHHQIELVNELEAVASSRQDLQHQVACLLLSLTCLLLF